MIPLLHVSSALFYSCDSQSLPSGKKVFRSECEILAYGRVALVTVGDCTCDSLSCWEPPVCSRTPLPTACFMSCNAYYNTLICKTVLPKLNFLLSIWSQNLQKEDVVNCSSGLELSSVWTIWGLYGFPSQDGNTSK